MIDIDLYQEQASNQVLLSIGDALLKEVVLVEYATDLVLEDGERASLLNKALDFISRVITRFLAWIKKGQLKWAKKHLENLQNRRTGGYNNMYQYAYERTLYTRFWDKKFYDTEIEQVIDEFLKLPIAKMINDGTVQGNYDRDVKKHITIIETMEKKLKEADVKLKKTEAYPVTWDHAGQLKEMLASIDKAGTTVYNDLKKSFDSIKIVRNAEKNRGHDDSKTVSEQYTHLMTLLGKCYLQEMTIMQHVAAMLTSGCELRRINFGGATGGKFDKQFVIENITLEQLFEQCRLTFNANPDIKTRGLLIYGLRIDASHYCIYLIDNYNLNDPTQLRGRVIGCKSVSQPINAFIKKHDMVPIMPADVNAS